jgi:hypothetical protein
VSLTFRRGTTSDCDIRLMPNGEAPGMSGEGKVLEVVDRAITLARSCGWVKPEDGTEMDCYIGPVNGGRRVKEHTGSG